MTSHEILQSDFLDILFDNRNKQYGAYTLRKQYDNRLMLSLGLALSIGAALLLFLSSGPGSKKAAVVSTKDSVVVQTFDVRKEPRKPEPPVVKKTALPVAPPMAQQRFTTLQIVHNDDIKPVATINDLQHVVISTVDVQGPAVGGTVPTPAPAATGTGAETHGDPLSSAPAETVQREPEFPGGMKAWLNFLTRYLQVPDEMEPGEKKTVLISFLVASDGSVTGLDVVQSGGARYDQEVMRVLKRMPKWKPAIQNNQPVARYFTQPVTFMGLE